MMAEVGGDAMFCAAAWLAAPSVPPSTSTDARNPRTRTLFFAFRPRLYLI
jgi:hypothetical protein